MYGPQGDKLEALTEATSVQDLAQRLVSILGHCSGRLEHRDRVSVHGQLGANATGALVEIGNARLPGGTPNGCALRISEGDLCALDGGDYAGTHDFTDATVLGINASGNASTMYGVAVPTVTSSGVDSMLKRASILSTRYGRLPFGRRFSVPFPDGTVELRDRQCLGGIYAFGDSVGDSTLAHVLTGSGPWVSYVDANKSNRSGTLIGGTVRIFLNRTTDQDPNIRFGDIVAYTMDDSGDAVAVDSQLDGKVLESYRDIHVTSPTSPNDYTGQFGFRGWRVADGNHGTQNRSGVMYQWVSGDPTFGTVGGSVSSTISGTISAHAASGTDPPISASMTHSAIAGALTGSMTHAAIAAALQSASAGVAGSSLTAIDLEANPATGGDPTFPRSIADPGHSHAAAGGGPASVTIAAAGGGPASVTATMTDDAVAAALANHTFTGSSVVPAGRVVLVLQRVN